MLLSPLRLPVPPPRLSRHYTKVTGVLQSAVVMTRCRWGKFLGDHARLVMYYCSPGRFRAIFLSLKFLL